jgi:hypothetical protein
MSCKVWMIHQVENGEYVWRLLTQERTDLARNLATTREEGRGPDMGSRLHRGTIIGMFRERGSGISLLAVEDDRRGKVLVPCEGTPTARAFDDAFGGVIVGGRFNNDGISDERIYYRCDDLGVLAEFSPVDDAPPEMVEQYDSAKKTESTPNPTKPEEPPKANGLRGVRMLGFLPPEDPIFSGGAMIFGKPHRLPKKKTPEK